MPNWPHAPVHRLEEPGAYIVTCGTFKNRHHFNTAKRLDLVQESLFLVAEEYGWTLQAWAVFSNHFHFVATPPGDPATLSRMMSKLHTLTATVINEEDEVPKRQVWFDYWKAHITFQTAWYARLKYVHQNPVHHGVVSDATTYRWCSAAWFQKHSKPAFVETVNRLKTESLNVNDEFDVLSLARIKA